MDRQELKQLINELDSNDRQLDSLLHILEGDGIDAGGRSITEHQIVVLSNRNNEIQDILDESGEDIEALRNEVE